MDKPDITTSDEVRDLIVAFYTRAFTDDMLGTVFTDTAKMDLDAHLPVMCQFWETVLFQTGAYRGNAYIPHANLNEKVTLTEPMFERWLEIWGETVDARFAGARADRAKLQAARIAKSIHHRLSLGAFKRPVSTMIHPRVPLDLPTES